MRHVYFRQSSYPASTVKKSNILENLLESDKVTKVVVTTARITPPHHTSQGRKPSPSTSVPARPSEPLLSMSINFVCLLTNQGKKTSHICKQHWHIGRSDWHSGTRQVSLCASMCEQLSSDVNIVNLRPSCSSHGPGNTAVRAVELTRITCVSRSQQLFILPTVIARFPL